MTPAMFKNSFDHIQLHVQAMDWCFVPAKSGGLLFSGRAFFLMDMCGNVKSNAIFGHVRQELQYLKHNTVGAVKTCALIKLELSKCKD